jgi:transposase
MDVTTYGLDTAKNVMQLHWVEPDGEIQRKKLSRTKLPEFFAQRAAGRIALEACAGSHHWARTLSQLGHEVELLPAGQVRSFVRGNKDDAADARAICLAATHGDIRRVPIKSCEQQSLQSLHRMRTHWVSVRTASINALRGLLYEFGVVLPQGKHTGLRTLTEKLGQAQHQLPATMVMLAQHQLEAIRQLDEYVRFYETQLQVLLKATDSARCLAEVPGIGVMGATALAATLGDGKGWRNAREFACCLGLTPRHCGSGGKIRLGAISKRGDPYLRTVLTNGARALLCSPKAPPWAQRLLLRRPFNVVTVALANKMARMAWALVAKGQRYDARWSCDGSVLPQAA